MKKLFLLLLAVMAVFSLVFTACEGVTNPDVITQGYTKIGDPVVTSQVYDGAVVISWRPVKDAVGYTLTRLDTVTLEYTDLTDDAILNQGGGYSVDIVNIGNELIDNRLYTYTVTAYSTLSVGVNGQQIATAPAHTGIVPTSEPQAPILNGATSVDVFARVPAELSAEYLPATPAITVVPVKSESAEWLKVTWTPPNQYNPGVSLRLTYSYGHDFAVDSYTLDVEATGTNLQGPTTALFPLIGGKNTVTAQYVWDKKRTSQLGLWYPSSTSVVDARDDAKSILADVGTSDFTVTPGQDRTAPYMTLYYSYDWEANGFTAAPTVTVYRAQVTGKTGSAGTYTSTNTGITNAGWVAVPLTWTPSTGTKTGNPTTSYGYTAEDTGIAVGKRYVYALSLTAGTQTAGSPAKDAIVTSVGLKSARLASVNVTTENKKKADGSPDGTQVVVNWIGDTTSQYVVTRALVEGTEIGKYAAITGTVVKDDKTLASNNNSVQYYLIDTTAAVRTLYAYKVVGTSSDGLINEEAADDTTETDYLSKPPYTTTGATLAGASGSGGSRQIILGVTQDTTDNNVYAGETVRIYYWPIENNNVIGKSEYVEFTKANLASGTPADRSKVVSSLNAYTTYKWQAYIYSGGKNFETSYGGTVTVGP